MRPRGSRGEEVLTPEDAMVAPPTLELCIQHIKILCRTLLYLLLFIRHLLLPLDTLHFRCKANEEGHRGHGDAKDPRRSESCEVRLQDAMESIRDRKFISNLRGTCGDDSRDRNIRCVCPQTANDAVREDALGGGDGDGAGDGLENWI